MKRQKLAVQPRKVLGKNVKKLRKEGFLPANIYGKDVKSTAVQVAFKDFEKIFKEAGETSLIDVELDGALRPVLIHNVQHDHLTRLPLHADFYQVNLKEKVKTMVPIVIIGEPKAVADKLGVLMQPLSEIEVEALPADLPENIEAKVEHLAAVGDQVTIADLKAPSGVEILTDTAQVVAKIDELISKEAQEQAAAEAAAAEAAKAEAPVEGEEQPAEGAEEAKPEADKPAETKPQA